MATNYPGSLDVFTNPTSGNTLDSPSHSLQHSDLNDAVEAIETKLGVGTATPGTATAYYPLVAGTAGATSWTQLTYQGITAGSATSGQVLTAGTAGTTTWSAPGLVLLTTQTFTTATSVSLATDTFTTTYNNYRILFNISASSGAPNINFRMRLSGTDNTASSYSYSGYQATAAALANDSATSQTSAKLGEVNNLYANFFYTSWDLFTPKLAVPTKYTVMTFGGSTGGAYEGYAISGIHDVSTAYDSLSVIPSTGTITGSYAIYGYSK